MRTKYEVMVGDEWYEVSEKLANKLRTHNVVDVRTIEVPDPSELMLSSFQKLLDEMPDEVLDKVMNEIDDTNIEGPTVEEYFEAITPDWGLNILENAADTSIMLFGNPTNPLPNLHHLLEELKETIAEPKDIFEYADMVILIAGAYKRANIGNFHDLMRTIMKKTEINLAGKWSDPDENGVRHRLD